MAAPVARRQDGPRCEACWEYERSGRRCRCAAPLLFDRVCLLCTADRDGRGDIAGAVRRWLADHDNQHYPRYWIRQRPGGRLLQQMLRGELAATHEALDRSTVSPNAVKTLRAYLLEWRILPPRDERLAAVELAIDEAAKAADLDDAQIIVRFGRWVVLRGVSVRIASGRARARTANYGTIKVRRVATLLADLREDKRTLGTFSQVWLDTWLTRHPSSRPIIRQFLAWARSQDLVTAPLAVDPPCPAELRVELEENARSDVLAKVLDDDAIAPRDRLAGFLLVGLGQPLTRIVSRRVEHVVSTDGITRLYLGSKALRMEPPVDQLVLRLVADAMKRQSPWLYPGRVGHLSSDRLGQRLATLGIASRLSARNAAWAALVTGAPPIVLSEKLGISVSGAERWTDAVAVSRSEYISLLAEGQP